MERNTLLAEIASKFAITGNVTDVKPLGNGLINDTFHVLTDGPQSYVMQRINTAIFTDVDMLMSNINAVTTHIRHKLEAKGETDIDRKVLRFLPLKADATKFYYTLPATNDKPAEVLRLMVFIPDSYTFETVDEHYSYEAGRAFGEFQDMLADIPVQLGDTIPDFHNMEFRLQQLREAVSADATHRVAEVRWLVDELEKRADAMCEGERLYRAGQLPKRICHCDTKVNNMLFDADGNVLCVIDLDTVMPNFIFSDFGDFMRTAANTGLEDDPNLDNVNFNMSIFKAFTKGYLEKAKFLTDIEISHLPYAAALFPYMQTVRFLADYINGDTYYKIKYPAHNLVRSKAQFKLLQSVEANTPAMQSFIASVR